MVYDNNLLVISKSVVYDNNLLGTLNLLVISICVLIQSYDSNYSYYVN